MRKIPIIAFTGRKGSGKDTAAEIITSFPDIAVLKVNFADTLKQMCQLVFGLSEEETNDPLRKEEITKKWPHQTPRFLMQHAAGQLRALWPDIWIRSWEGKVQRDFSDLVYCSVVITDLRYENEHNFLVNHPDFDVTVVKIKRPSILKGDDSEKHESEIFVDHMPCDVEIMNEGTKEEFASKVKAFLTIWENAHVAR